MKRGNLKRSKLTTGRQINDSNYIGASIVEDTPMHKDSTSNIQSTNLAQGNIDLNQH